MAGSIVGIGASSSSGSGKAFFNDAVAATAVQIKATTGQLYLLDLVNTTAAAAYLQVFFKPSASVTVGTTAPDMTIRLLASVGKTLVLTVPVGYPPGTTPQTAGLTVAGTTTATGAVGAAISVSAVFM
jgi:hypothetical protein